jgi:hypothetical protein
MKKNPIATMVLVLQMTIILGFLPELSNIASDSHQYHQAYAQNSLQNGMQVNPSSSIEIKTLDAQEQNQKQLSLLVQSHRTMRELKIGFVVPIFTESAYNHASFYDFYAIYAKTKPGVNVTHNLEFLSAKVTAFKPLFIGAYAATMHDLVKHVRLLSPLYNITLLNDADVDAGFITMKNGTNKYDVLILGHQEYVTQKEYNNLKEFVAKGGTMILLDANAFFAQVGYDRYTHTITLIKGHSWEFNGRSAWRSANETWATQNSEWVGSNFLCFHVRCRISFANNPFGYTPHEEQYLTNPNDTVLLNYNASVLSPNPKAAKNATIDHEWTVATYELNYKKGKVIALGIYSDDLIHYRSFLVFFDHLLMGSRHYNLCSD